jgi:hypothetical protein
MLVGQHGSARPFQIVIPLYLCQNWPIAHEGRGKLRTKTQTC